jgi:Arc/MetJ family transcription regulator
MASLRASDDATLDAEASVRTTVTIDDELLARATELTGITERSALLRDGLETLIRVESAKRLAALGGSDSDAIAAPRRRDGAK